MLGLLSNLKWPIRMSAQIFLACVISGFTTELMLAACTELGIRPATCLIYRDCSKIEIDKLAAPRYHAAVHREPGAGGGVGHGRGHHSQGLKAVRGGPAGGGGGEEKTMAGMFKSAQRRWCRQRRWPRARVATRQRRKGRVRPVRRWWRLAPRAPRW